LAAVFGVNCNFEKSALPPLEKMATGNFSPRPFNPVEEAVMKFFPSPCPLRIISSDYPPIQFSRRPTTMMFCPSLPPFLQAGMRRAFFRLKRPFSSFFLPVLPPVKNCFFFYPTPDYFTRSPKADPMETFFPLRFPLVGLDSGTRV